ncbi:hypothetical protein ACVBEF_15800 [Glaciimonas sp. GG7]
MGIKSTYALLIDALDLRHWFMSRTVNLTSAGHRKLMNEVLNEKIANFIDQLGGMAGEW